MLKRKMQDVLKSIFAHEAKSLLISGARQVGKTYIIRQAAKEVFENVVELNFVENPEYKNLFDASSNVSDLLLRLSVATGKRLVPGRTLIFFDEVQECPEVVTMIKFLVDEGSYRYVLSGSLLGVEMKNIRSVPVGYLDEIQMYPLDFEEFAWAVGMSDDVMDHLRQCFDKCLPVDEVVHRKMMELLHLYLVVGGMPAAVQRYVDTNNLRQVLSVQRSVVNLYRKDISRYDPDNRLFIRDVFDLIPSELNDKNKRFILKKLNENAKFSRFYNSFLWLADAGVALPTYNIEEPRIPLLLNTQRNLFKLFLCDVGLLCSMYASGIQFKMLTGQVNLNYGAVFENFAAQQLVANGFALHYFNSKRQGELDFVLEDDGRVIPVEIKSGKDYKFHNALSNVLANPEYAIERAYIFSASNVERKERKVYMPVYMLMFLKPYSPDLGVYSFKPL